MRYGLTTNAIEVSNVCQLKTRIVKQDGSLNKLCRQYSVAVALAERKPRFFAVAFNAKPLDIKRP